MRSLEEDNKALTKKLEKRSKAEEEDTQSILIDYEREKERSADLEIQVIELKASAGALAEEKHELQKQTQTLERSLQDEKENHEATKQEVKELQQQVASLVEAKERLEKNVQKSDEKLLALESTMEELEKKLSEEGIEVEQEEQAEQETSTTVVAQQPHSQERFVQWAWKVLDFSSQASEDNDNNGAWGVHGLLGAPEVTAYGDSEHAWAPKETNGGAEWVVVQFQKKVKLTEVRILENWNPGATHKVEVQNEDGEWELLWEKKAKEQPARLRIVQAKRAKPLDYYVDTVKIHLNTERVYDEWNEIGAIQLEGYLPEGDDGILSPFVKPRKQTPVTSEETPETPQVQEAPKATGGPPPPGGGPPPPAGGPPPPAGGPPPPGGGPPAPGGINLASAPALKSVKRESAAPSSGGAPAFGSKEFLSLLQKAKGVLKNAEDRVVDKVEPEEDEMTAALKKRFDAIHGTGDYEDLDDSDWDSDDADWDDAAWDDDDNDFI
eukprot:TRINITY_DN2279_c0_g1_i4.p1 TRINITY_DN2279_c0_g1~~TRINITY_DN2279_c0_g1_i4.p1  ORF type:complete len:495 (+),score=170.58 TRINITY_DN2279_c0_g1_i4:188-1672(+)